MCDLWYIRITVLLSGVDYHSILPLNCDFDINSMFGPWTKTSSWLAIGKLPGTSEAYT